MPTGFFFSFVEWDIHACMPHEFALLKPKSFKKNYPGSSIVRRYSCYLDNRRYHQSPAGGAIFIATFGHLYQSSDGEIGALRFPEVNQAGIFLFPR